MVGYFTSVISLQNTRGTVSWPLVLYGRLFHFMIGLQNTRGTVTRPLILYGRLFHFNDCFSNY